MVASPPFPPPLRYRKEGNENNLKSVTYVAEHLPLKRELLIKRTALICIILGFTISLILAALLSSATTSCGVYLATLLAADLPS